MWDVFGVDTSEYVVDIVESWRSCRCGSNPTRRTRTQTNIDATASAHALGKLAAILRAVARRRHSEEWTALSVLSRVAGSGGKQQRRGFPPGGWPCSSMDPLQGRRRGCQARCLLISLNSVWRLLAIKLVVAQYSQVLKGWDDHRRWLVDSNSFEMKFDDAPGAVKQPSWDLCMTHTLMMGVRQIWSVRSTEPILEHRCWRCQGT